MNTWEYPLLGVKKSLPVGQGAFAAKRKYDTHTGVDLYCNPSQTVVAVEDGVVVGIEDFTGLKAGSDWWLDTKAVLVEGNSGVILYGEIDPCVIMGQQMLKGEHIGFVLRVLKVDKGLPTNMLHLELYTPGTTKSEWWREKRPDNLLDPTEYLENSKEKIIYGDF